MAQSQGILANFNNQFNVNIYLHFIGYCLSFTYFTLHLVVSWLGRGNLTIDIV